MTAAACPRCWRPLKEPGAQTCNRPHHPEPDYHDGEPCDCYPPRPPELRPCDEYAARAAATATYPLSEETP